GEAIAQTPASTSPSPAAVRATPPATVLKQGDRGAEVVELQMKLKQLGYYTGAADGAFGETTKIAVAKFQKALKLPADGTVGAPTWDKLQTAQDAKANPPKKSKPKAAAKPRSKKKMLFLLLSAIVVAATVGGSVYLLLKSFGKAINLEPEEDEADDANQQLQDNPFAPQNHRSNGIAAHTDTSSNGNSKNGYGSTEQFLADTTDTTGSYTSEDSSDIPHDLGNKTASPNVDGHLSNLSPQEEQAPQDPWLADSDRGAKGNAELPNVDKNFSKEEKIPDAPNPSGTSSSLSPTGDTKPQDGLQIEKTTKLPKIDIVEELIKDLQGGNSQKRRKAIWELAQRG
ncbi:MAG TPA: peptidoglycan-binding protein, partial [Candidatus Obscuribacterales bacterium]